MQPRIASSTALKKAVLPKKSETPLTIGDLMTRTIITVMPNDRLYQVQHLLYENGIHHLLVTEGRHLLGVISDRDVLRTISPFLDTEAEDLKDSRTLHKRASEVMTPAPVVVEPDSSIPHAAKLLLDNNISCLPVVSAEGFLEGIVTWKDILWHIVRDTEPEPPHAVA